MTQEPTITYSEEVKRKMQENPEIAEFVRSVSASFRQAHHGVQTGQYSSIMEGIEAITGSSPKIVHEPEEEEEDYLLS